MLINLHGDGVGGSDPVYARAALMLDDGRATLDPELLTLAALRKKRGDDSLEVILVASDAAQALLTRLPEGLTLAGIIAERGLSFAPSNDLEIALIVNVEGAREQIAEGSLLIVDPERGQILVEPDAEEFARLQAERSHRPRVLLGAAHTPARTQAGRAVAVWAEIRSLADVEPALDGGADGLFIASGGDLIREDVPVPEEEALRPLVAAVEMLGGGDVALRCAFDALDLTTIVQLAARCRLRWVLVASDLPLPLSFFRDELDGLITEENRERRLAAMPLLAAYTDSPDRADALGFAELFLSPTALAPLTVTDTFEMPPFHAVLGEDLSLLPHAVAVGARGLVVSATCAETAKDLVRQQEY